MHFSESAFILFLINSLTGIEFLVYIYFLQNVKLFYYVLESIIADNNHPMNITAVLFCFAT